MQFRAAQRYGEPELPSSSVALRRPLDAHDDDETAFQNLAGHPKKPPHQPPAQVQSQAQLLPGSLLSIKASGGNNQSQQRLAIASTIAVQAATATKKLKKQSSTSSKKAPPSLLPPNFTPEPINYIKLRRTEQSKQALLRNRQVVQEILTPALSPTASSKDTKKDKQQQLLFQPQLQPPLPTPNAVLVDLKRSFRDKGQVGSASIAAGMQKLYCEQSHVDAQVLKASTQLQHLLTDIRNDISLLYKFTPLFKIYTRHKLAPRWIKWREYTLWHRAGQQQLELLAPYAVHIQRVFRKKRTRWLRARERLTIAWTQWQAVIVLQRWMKNWLRAQTQIRKRETLYAAKVQAAWRGRKVRKQVKRALQDQLRWLLASLTPTGNLHRLHEVITRSQQPELARQVNYMLTLIAETHVSIDVDGKSQHRPKHAAIAAKHYARPVEATRKQLFHAVHELKYIIKQREMEIVAAKQAFLDEKQARKVEKEQYEAKMKLEKLCVIKERIAAGKERVAIEKAELETREFVRAAKTAEADMILRRKLKVTRCEQAENTLMMIEEYQTRYQVAESRRRELESKKRLDEVAKREQFLHDQAQSQLTELLAIMKNDELKRLEFQQKHLESKAAAQKKWAHLSKDERAQALKRLELKEQQQLAQQREAEGQKLAHEEAASEAKRRKEEMRAKHQEELARELDERSMMSQEEKLVRKWHFAMRKSLHSSHWQEKREKEKVKYSIDPMHFAQVQLQKEQDERERRERFCMKKEHELSAAVREKEHKEAYFQLCREKKRLRLVDEGKEHKEMVLMEKEELLVLEQRNVLRKAGEFKIQLQRMQQLADREQKRERGRILEAKSRKEMHDEELRQRRVQQTLEFLESVREKRERQSMEEQERVQRYVDARRMRKEEKRLRAKMNLRMMKEDVESMERQDWEDEGLRLEQLLWTPFDAAAFSHFVSFHGEFLRINVQVLKGLVGSSLSRPPPFELDYDAVRAHLVDEQELPIDNVPPKKRKPRKFFYHEFFEDDLILARSRKPSPPPISEEEEQAKAAKRQARERWKMLGRHFFGYMWNSESSRRGYLQMHNQQYEDACTSLLEAVHGIQNTSPSKPVSAALLRQLARCYLKLWETRVQRTWLDKSLFFFQQASAHVLLLTSPSFLQEIAFVLEQVGSYRHAAEILGGVIQCFPRHARLAQVIFRGAVVMFALQMYRQAREYLLHVLDARPFGWEPFEIQFLVARVMQFEGKLSKRLCAVAYEDAFQKRNKRSAFYKSYPTWKEWIKATDTWRRFGDACFEKREFVLAKDAYQVMLKRQMEKPAHLVSKRQQVRSLQKSHQGRESDQIHDENDWLRLARVCAALNERSKTVLALSRWFASKSYRERVLEQFCAWPLVRWKLLGIEIPENVVLAREQRKKTKENAEMKLQREIEEQRQQVLIARNNKSKTVMAAWQEEETTSTTGSISGAGELHGGPISSVSSIPTVQQWVSTSPAVAAAEREQIERPWHRVVGFDANEVYY